MTMDAATMWLPVLLLTLVLVEGLEPVTFLTREAQGELAVRNDTRAAKFFPFFSIIRFENKECGGPNSFNGTCFTRRECKDLGGSYSGTCASRRGVCCIVQKSCGGATNVNNTYFTNAGYPGSFGGGGRCSITINRCNSEICQLRLEFLEFALAQPSGDGVCVNDALVVSGGSSLVPRLCGDAAGQHVYVNFNGDAPITLAVDASSAVAFSRRWNIKITQIACNCPTIAPSGCLQYYSGVSGSVSSFNYGNMQNQALTPIGQPGTRELANLNYGVCIRMEAGHCSIRWSQDADPLAFTVSGDVPGLPTSLLGTPDAANVGALCTTDYVIIPSSAANSDRYCGLGFTPLTTFAKPFVMHVITNGNEGTDIGNRGFNLQYAQQPCLPV